QTGAENFKIHFHTSSGRSLARLWRNGWQAKRNGQKVDISDDLTSFRKTVVEINQGSHTALTGIEIGRGGFALRGLAPITGPEDEHLGSCEVLLPFAEILKSNHVDQNYQIAVYMLADLLPIATKLQDPDKNPILDSRYVYTSSTNPKVTSSVITPALLDAGRTAEHQQMVGEHFVSTFPVNDFSGNRVGVMALVYGMDNIKRLADRMNAYGSRTIDSISFRFAAGGTVLVCLAVAILLFLSKLLLRPLQMAVCSAQKVALGDLTEPVPYRSNDETGVLADAINTMIHSLETKTGEARRIAEGDLQTTVSAASKKDTMGRAFRDMVDTLNSNFGRIHGIAGQIDSGSSQVASTAQSLSQGATESAASLEEISSSMHEIARQASQSAESANQAKKLTTDAQNATLSGRKEMDQMVSSMAEISEAGQSIRKIIKVIDEIAFQTNLLALNAAVEAARAGQHGKGFSVVAEEVRSLAARSAKAAEETEELIEHSVAKTENGTRVARSTAEALDEINGVISRVNDLVGEIAVAGTEQAQGITQINQGLSQIDQAVQQNTATAQEASASAVQLSAQADQLRRMLARFRLAGTGQASGKDSATATSAASAGILPASHPIR
ncbi:MAG TPA: methyl-accepting chemotaxis protein, partial [Desulfomicrobiaceae bacterium]|nr:methyl-accepting chemotaxis protein [Desulfomicrobiaceae bacterium]